MMARVSLGHTGRDLQVGENDHSSFCFAVAGWPSADLASLAGFPLLLWQVSALLWLCAFAIFLWFYWPVLIQPRADGRPG